MKKIRVGVIFGGRSGEHEVSLASAAAVFQNIDPEKYEAVPIRIEKDGRWALPDRAPTMMKAADVIQSKALEDGSAGAGNTDTRRGEAGPDDPGDIDPRKRDPGGGAPRTIPGGRAPRTIPGDRAPRTFKDAQLAPRPDVGTLISGVPLDVIFPVLHGPYGEDGTVQGLLELANVPYVGAGVLASAVGMDKATMKLVFAAKGLSICDYEVVLKHEWARDERSIMNRVASRLGFPLFVKPANLGSSVGISKAKHAAELRAAINLAAEFDRKIVIEAAVPNAREIECAVLGNDEPEASVPGEVIPSREFYDYEAKYLDEASRTEIPAKLTPEQVTEIQALAIAAFQAIDCAGMARVDFLLARETGVLYLNEVNTIPGFTTISMYSKMWDASGLPYPKLIDRLITFAIERHAAKQLLRTSM